MYVNCTNIALFFDFCFTDGDITGLRKYLKVITKQACLPECNQYII